MTREYFLRTERLGFSRWMPEDIELANSLWGTPDVAKFVSAEGYFSDLEVENKLQIELLNMQNYNIQYYPIFLLGDTEFVGCCGLKPFEDKEHIYEFGFYIRPEYWKKGYAKEAGIKVLDYAVNILKADNIYARHHPENASSQKALERLGFKYFMDMFYEPTGLMHPSYRLFEK